MAAVFDMSSGQLAVAVPIRNFQFKRTLVQEHCNENYVESAKFSRATSPGQVVNAAQVLKQLPNGTQHVKVEGNLSIHGVTRKVVVTGTIQMRAGQTVVFAYFNVAPADYASNVSLLREHIAKSVSVRLSLSCEPMGNSLTQQP